MTNFKTAVVALVSCCGMFFLQACSKETASPITSTQTTEISIGVLTDLTGSASSIGVSAWSALQFAVADINASLSASQSPLHLKLVMVDCASNPDSALRAARTLATQGIKTFIGPFTSSATLAVKPFVDSMGLIVLSPSSVATTLSLPGDNIFRMPPDDSLQSRAISALFAVDSITCIVQLYRDDVWGAGLSANTKLVFGGKGVVAGGVAYVSTDTNFTIPLQSVRTFITSAVAQFGASHVAVQVMSFGEIVPLMRQAATDSVFTSVRWYGASAAAKSSPMLADPVARDFVLKTNYTSPLFGLDDQAATIWQPLESRISAAIGYDPTVYALTAYDAAWLMIKTYLATNGSFVTANFKTALVSNAASYFGATGRTEMNSNGDRKTGDIDFWAPRNSAGAVTWVRNAQWHPSGEIVRY